MEIKICRTYSRVLSVADFSKTRGYLLKDCKKCRYSWKLQYERKRRISGYTPEMADKLLREQDGRCAICEKLFTDTPCVDHDHQTNKIRGLLCRACNSGLGHFRDDLNLLERAIVYLSQ